MDDTVQAESLPQAREHEILSVGHRVQELSLTGLFCLRGSEATTKTRPDGL